MMLALLPPPSCCSGRGAGMRLATVPAALALLGACATTPRQLPPPAQAELIREAFTHPVMDSCDELSCSYFIDRYFRVRDVVCTPVPIRPEQSRPQVDCIYERQAMPSNWMTPVLVTSRRPPEPVEPSGPWEKARTLFMMQSDRQWSVLRDPYYGH